jgi:hypothetical protein
MGWDGDCVCPVSGPPTLAESLRALVHAWVVAFRWDWTWRQPLLDPRECAAWIFRGSEREWSREEWSALVNAIQRKVRTMLLDDCMMCREEEDPWHREHCPVCLGEGVILDDHIPRIIASYPGAPERVICGGCSGPIDRDTSFCEVCDREMCPYPEAEPHPLADILAAE